MDRQPLGRSNLAVTPLGLGLAALGRPGYINLGHGDDLTNRDVAALKAAAAAHDCTVDALALAAVINQPFGALTLSGAAHVDHLRANVQALNVSWDDAAAEMLRDLREPSERYWHTRSQLAWN